MKKFTYLQCFKTHWLLLFFTIFILQNSKAQTACCPKFSMSFPEFCKDTTVRCPQNSTGTPGRLLMACKNTKSTYTVFPNQPGYTYTWTVTGGTAATSSGNPMEITWGSGSSGSFTVVMSNGVCADSFSKTFCMIDGPKANFTFISPACTGGVNFTNTSIGGNLFTWTFGDGTSFFGANPPTHVYSTPGTYVVTLLADNNSNIYNQCESCKDLKRDTIVVVSGSGPIINTVGCYGTLCANHTPLITNYSTPSTCSPLVWSIPTGAGTITGNGTPNISVNWNPTFTGTPTVTLSVPAGCTGLCPATTTIQVPIIFPNLPITGPSTVCVNSNNNYSIPLLPGCFYTTSITSNTSLASFNNILSTYNNNEVSVNAGPYAGNYTINFTYYDSITHCGGSSSKVVTVKDKFSIYFWNTLKYCAGNTSTIMANSNATWQVYDVFNNPVGSPYTGSSPSIAWNTPGTYTLVATSTTPALFCNSSDQVTITVVANPVLSTTMALTAPICPNSLETIHINSSNMAGNFTWTASAGNSVVANDDTTVTVMWGASGGTISVSEALSSSPFCASNTITFTRTIFATPTISGSITACEDDTFTYTATPAGMPFYTWKPTWGSIVSQTGNTVSIVWAGHSGGGHLIKVTTCSGTFSLSVTVKTKSPTTVSSTISGCTAILTATTAATPVPTGYLWYLNGVLQPQNTQTVTVASGGVWSCLPTGPGCYKIGILSVTLPTPPIVNITTPVNVFCPTVPSITFTSAVSVGGTVSYQWFGPLFNGGPTVNLGIGATSATYTPSTTYTGTYYLQVNYGTGCTVNSNSITISVNCTPPLPCTLPLLPNISFSSSCPTVPSTTGAIRNFMESFASTVPAGTSISWSWGDGTPNSSSLPSVGSSHTYTLPGVYQVCATATNSSYCPVSYCANVIINIVPKFSVVVNCNGTEILTDNSQVLAGTGAYTISWATTGGTLSAASGSPVTLTGSGNVIMTTCYLGCCNSYLQSVTASSSSVSITALTQACKNDIITFSTSPAPANYLIFNWNFGDATTSSTAAIGHAYNTASAPFSTYTINLITTDLYGCTASGTASIRIDTLPKATLITDTFFCPNSFATLTASSGYNNYNWIKDFVSYPPTTTSNTNLVNQSGIYTVQVTDGHGCKGYSNFVPVIKVPLPKYDLNFPNGTSACVNATLGDYLPVNATPIGNNSINYIYTWSATTPLTWTTYYPSNFGAITIPAGTAPGVYYFYLTVKDTLHGCVKSDTVCINVKDKPTLSIAPNVAFCEGVPTVLTPTPNNTSLYTYNWSNGTTTPLTTVSLAGIYTLTITNALGCSVSSFITVNPIPDLKLFPVGCDTLCDTAKVYIPLPNIYSTFPPSGMYPTIQWYVDGVANTTGNILNLITLPLGSHQVHVTVTGQNGCMNTSNDYNIFIENCKATCKDSSCNQFLMSLNGKTIAINNTAAPTITFTPPTLISTDIVRWDFDCNGTVDMVTYGNTTATHNYLTAGNYLLCARIERILFGDTCWANFCHLVKIDSPVVNHCVCDTTFTANVNSGFATSMSGSSMTFVPIALTNCDTITWDFGDASTGTSIGNNPVTHVYATSGSYFVCMTVIRAGSLNCKKRFCKKVVVQIISCVCDTTFTANVNSGFATSTSGNSVTFVPLALTNCDTVSWTFGDGGIMTSVGNNPVTHVYAAIGTYKVCMLVTRAGSPNCRLEFCKKVNLSTAVQEVNNSSLKIYPNPTNNKLFVTMDSKNALENIQIWLYDMTGRKILEQLWVNSSTNQELNLEEFASGVYTLSIVNSEGKQLTNQRVIKY